MLKKMLRLLVIGFGEPIHVPQAAMMRLPRIQRVRWPENGAVPLDEFDFVSNGSDDLVADLVEHEKRVVCFIVVDLRPNDMGCARLHKLNGNGEAVILALQRSTDDIVDIKHPAGLFRCDAPLAQGKDSSLGNDKEAPQLGEPRDDVVGETVGWTAWHIRCGALAGKGHHRDGCAPWRTQRRS